MVPSSPQKVSTAFYYCFNWCPQATVMRPGSALPCPESSTGLRGGGFPKFAVLERSSLNTSSSYQWVHAHPTSTSQHCHRSVQVNQPDTAHKLAESASQVVPRPGDVQPAPQELPDNWPRWNSNQSRTGPVSLDLDKREGVQRKPGSAV